MISKLIKKGESYYCSNCMMRQPTIKNNCWFCSDLFSNFESVILELYEIVETDNCKNKGLVE